MGKEQAIIHMDSQINQKKRMSVCLSCQKRGQVKNTVRSPALQRSLKYREQKTHSTQQKDWEQVETITLPLSKVQKYYLSPSWTVVLYLMHRHAIYINPLISLLERKKKVSILNCLTTSLNPSQFLFINRNVVQIVDYMFDCRQITDKKTFYIKLVINWKFINCINFS